MNLTILGTGNATATHCYNTCFVLDEGGQYLLVDGGGGNGLLQQLEKTQLRWQDMRTVFVTHKHMDHLLGILWLMRMMCQSWRRGTYDGEAVIYGHEEVISLLRTMGKALLSSKDGAFLDDRLHLITVADGEKPMSGIANGSFTKLSASMPKRISSIPMKNTILPSKTPVRRRPAWAYRI